MQMVGWRSQNLHKETFEIILKAQRTNGLEPRKINGDLIVKHAKYSLIWEVHIMLDLRIQTANY